jgi:DNA polymerase I-like protein with 3'-5' exonuclease and polymerase domains
MTYPNYVVWDLETTIRSSFKRKGNPFDPLNFVVMSGYKARDSLHVGGDYFGRNPKPHDWFTKLLGGHKLLVGQNIKFDILYALADQEHGEANLRAWMAWVASGGLVWDIQLAEYLLKGMDPAENMLSLDQLAPRYGGNLKFDEVKALWEAGVSTEDIDPNLLRRYLCGTSAQDGTPLDHGDIGNTELVFRGQLDIARACGQVKSILLNMGSLLCTIEMERNGMAVDVQLGMEQAKKLEEKIAELSVELSSYLPPDLPFAFNWGSSRQKSAIIFGGKVKYQAREPILNEDGTQAYPQVDATVYLTEDGEQVAADDPRLEDLGWKTLNLSTFKSGKNAGEYKTKKVKVPDLTRPKSRWADFYYEFPGVTEPKKAWQGAVEGVYSTSSEVISALSNRGIPFLESLGKVTSLTKDLTTYYISTDDDGESKGMLTLVQADGIIHHMLNHTSTVTARFSSSNPNLQNLPKGDKSDVKRMFRSRFQSGKIIQSDFSSLEVYIQAILTNCKQLIEDLKQGLDMHCVRVSQSEGIPYEEALRLCVTEAIKEWKIKRTKAKIFSFQRAYGAGASLIAEQTGMSLEEVEALIAAENERYPEIEAFYTKLTEKIKANSIPTSMFANHPDIPGLKCNFRKSFYRTPDNKLYSYREQPAPEFLARRGTSTSFSPTEIKNYIVQGEGGEWAKAAMWLAVRAFYSRKNFDGLALLVNQVHDALYADADDSVAIEAAALLEACMLAASDFMEYYFAWPCPVPVPSDTTWGRTMMEEERMPEGFRPKVAAYRQQLRAEYMAGYVPSFDVPSIKDK